MVGETTTAFFARMPMKFFDTRSWRPYFAGSVAAHLLLAGSSLLFRSDLDAHAPKVMYADLLAPEPPAPAAPAAAPRAFARRAEAAVPAAPKEAEPEKAAEASPPIPAGNGAGKAGSEAEGPPAQAGGAELNLYVSRVIDLLNRARTYPRDALSREEEGVVVLEVSVAGDGALSGERVELPSPYPSLNRAALETLRRVGRFPAPPRPQLTLHVPVRFKIQGR